MAMRPEDFAIFKAHLEKAATPDASCPVCGTAKWSADGPVAIPTYEDRSDGPAAVGAGYFPVVLLYCQKCFFARQFAWLPIQKAAKDG